MTADELHAVRDELEDKLKSARNAIFFVESTLANEPEPLDREKLLRFLALARNEVLRAEAIVTGDDTSKSGTRPAVGNGC